ncbi:MAG: hypothetical protein IK086_06290 [Clostridia bacterium]|nr:hypothetical protein [Clostridia bacterium]
MDIDTARDFLKEYRVLIAKIARLKLMPTISPENKNLYTLEINRCISRRDRIEKSINSVDGGLLSEILALK